MAQPTHADIEYMLMHQDDDRRPNYVAANAICIGLAILAVVLRFVSRTIAGVRLGLDDYTIFASLLFTIIYTACLFVLVHYGMGRHVVPYLTEVKPFAQWALVAETFYNVSIMTTKISILALFNRIFPFRWFKLTIYALGAFIIAYSVPQMFGTIFQCVPIHSKWTPGVVPKCINYVAMIIACGVINIVTDFIILGLPIPALWALQVSSHRKWALTFMFMIGGLVCIISIVRLFYARHVDTVDATWDFVWPSTISGLECCSAIVAACVPTWRPIVNKIRHGVAAENTVPQPTKPTNGSWSRSGGIAMPLRRLLNSKRSNVSVTSNDSHDDARLYNQLGREGDFEARVETATHDERPRPHACKKNILVTHSFTSQST